MKLSTRRKIRSIPQYLGRLTGRGHIRIGVIYSFEGEAASIQRLFKKRLIKRREVFETNWTTYRRGWLKNGNEVIISQCGMGKVNATALAFDMIQRFNIDVMVLTGSCGGNVLEGVKPMDIVVANGIDIYDAIIPGCEANTRSYEHETLTDFLSQDVLDAAPISIHSGLMLTADRFANFEDFEALSKKYNHPLACDMESGAVAIICERFNVPMVCVKMVSDAPAPNVNSEKNIADFMSFWKEDHNYFTEFTGKVLAALTQKNLALWKKQCPHHIQ